MCYKILIKMSATRILYSKQSIIRVVDECTSYHFDNLWHDIEPGIIPRLHHIKFFDDVHSVYQCINTINVHLQTTDTNVNYKWKLVDTWRDVGINDIKIENPDAACIKDILPPYNMSFIFRGIVNENIKCECEFELHWIMELPKIQESLQEPLQDPIQEPIQNPLQLGQQYTNLQFIMHTITELYNTTGYTLCTITCTFGIIYAINRRQKLRYGWRLLGL